MAGANSWSARYEGNAGHKNPERCLDRSWRMSRMLHYKRSFRIEGRAAVSALSYEWMQEAKRNGEKTLEPQKKINKIN